MVMSDITYDLSSEYVDPKISDSPHTMTGPG